MNRLIQLTLFVVVALVVLWMLRPEPERVPPAPGGVVPETPRDAPTSESNAESAVEPNVANELPTRAPVVAEPKPVTAELEPVEATPSRTPIGEALPTGCVEVLVLRDERPVDDGWVHCAPFTPQGFPSDPRAADADVTHFGIGANGVARLEGLEPGAYRTLAVEYGGALYQHTLRLPEVAGQRLEVRLGSARLHGHVYRPDGTPEDRAAVDTRLPGSQFSVRSATDAAGAYELLNLPAGLVQVRVSTPGESQPSASVPLAIGEDRAHDFGSAQPWPILLGTVFDRAGQPVSGLGRPGRRLLLTRTDGGWRDEFSLGLDGSYELRAPAASYQIALKPPSSDRERHKLHDAFELRGPSIALDLVLPGTTVRGLVTVAGTGDVLGAADAKSQTISLRNEAGTLSLYEVPLAADGSYTLYGVAPGTYVFSAERRSLAAAPTLQVREQDLELLRNLELASP